MKSILGSKSRRYCWEETGVGWLLERNVWSDAKTRRLSCTDVLTWCMWATSLLLMMMKLIYIIKEDRVCVRRDEVLSEVCLLLCRVRTVAGDACKWTSKSISWPSNDVLGRCLVKILSKVEQCKLV